MICLKFEFVIIPLLNCETFSEQIKQYSQLINEYNGINHILLMNFQDRSQMTK